MFSLKACAQTKLATNRGSGALGQGFPGNKDVALAR
jgi:hypothetical protein